MKKRYLIFIFLILFSIGIFIINATVDKTKGWHSGNIFLIKIDNNDKTLQQAITDDLLRGSHTYAQPSSTSIPDPGHSAEQIWISINGNENTLLQALSLANKLCDSSPGTLINSYSSSPTDKTKPYHFANQVEVTVDTFTMSLQEAIDNGKFNPSNFGANCPSGDPNCINGGTIQCDGSCSGSYKSLGTSCGTNLQCDGNGNCVSTCVSNVGQSCDDGNSCTIGETIQCDGTCSGGSPVARGTNCNAEGTYACDGAGKCEGWSGSGDDSYVYCPFGFYQKKEQLDYDSTLCKAYVSYCNLNGNQGRYYNPYHVKNCVETCTGGGRNRECTTICTWEPQFYWTDWSYTKDPIADIAVCSDCVFGLYCREYKGKVSGWSPSWQIKPYL